MEFLKQRESFKMVKTFGGRHFIVMHTTRKAISGKSCFGNVNIKIIVRGKITDY